MLEDSVVAKLSLCCMYLEAGRLFDGLLLFLIVGDTGRIVEDVIDLGAVAFFFSVFSSLEWLRVSITDVFLFFFDAIIIRIVELIRSEIK